MQGISINQVSGSSLYTIIRAAVLPSQKCSTAYTTAVAVNKMNGQVIYGRCSCIAGKSACNHTAALMFAIDDTNKERSSHGSGGSPSCTSLPKRWGVPAKPTRGKDKKLQVLKPTYGKLPQQSPMDTTEPIDPSQSLVDIGRVMSLWEILKKIVNKRYCLIRCGP